MLPKGTGMNIKVVFSITTTAPTRRLVALIGVGQRGWITFSRYLSTGTARCTRAARQRTGGDAAWENRGRLAREHLERGDHEQRAGHLCDTTRYDRDHGEQEHDDPERA